MRRNSLSLHDWSPPPGSLAREILGLDSGAAVSSNPGQHYAKARNILDGLKEMTDRFSDFGSAKEWSSSSSYSVSDKKGDYKYQGRKKKRKYYSNKRQFSEEAKYCC